MAAPASTQALPSAASSAGVQGTLRLAVRSARSLARTSMITLRLAI